MNQLSFTDPDETCEFCGGVEYYISATMIQCMQCLVIWGRVNGVWVPDPLTVPTAHSDDEADSR